MLYKNRYKDKFKNKYLKRGLHLILWMTVGTLTVHAYARSLNDGVEINIAAANLSYKEYSGGKILDSEAGTMPGVQIAYGHDWGPLFFKLQGSYYHGSLSYQGGYLTQQFTTVASSFTHQRTIYDIMAHIGGKQSLSENVLLREYIEWGYRYWDRFIPAPPVAGGESLAEVYENNYLGLGAALSWWLSDHVALRPSASVGYILYPYMKANSNTFHGTFELGSRPYYDLALAAYYDVDAHLRFNMHVGYKAFEYGASPIYIAANTGTQYQEPKSDTKTIYFGAGMGYSF